MGPGFPVDGAEEIEQQTGAEHALDWDEAGAIDNGVGWGRDWQGKAQARAEARPQCWHDRRDAGRLRDRDHDRGHHAGCGGVGDQLADQHRDDDCASREAPDRLTSEQSHDPLTYRV